MSTSGHGDSDRGLGSRALLDKIDKLRELGISSIVPLPQMVVVGDQSAGKSSVLESLTGFHFPRGVKLCTRHATEIICRLEDTESIVISIHAVNADPEKAKAFRREATGLDAEAFAKIFDEAAKVMGIKTSLDENEHGSAFSRDVLRVEINGPKEEHLTVINVPGMFENSTPGVTTDDDIEIVKNMVTTYIQEARTIILAVVPCNGGIANQKILRLALEADPDGKRTLGVLTKPDLAPEEATKREIIDLVQGKRRDLHLGYCIVKNRGADDSSSSLAERHLRENEFFRKAPWTKLPANRLGIPALRQRLQSLLMDRTKSEFPKVRAELDAKCKESQRLLTDMGDSRSTPEMQRLYLGKIASQFSQIKNFALDAYYTRDDIFSQDKDLKLITRIREVNELFSHVMCTKGHTRNFATLTDAEKQRIYGPSDIASDEGALRDDLYDNATKFCIPSLGEDELDGILSKNYTCPGPLSEDIMVYIESEYLSSRGYEMGTEQSKKWPQITRAHVSNAMLIVHHLIRTVLKHVCQEEDVRGELWNFLLEDVQKRYKRAMDHTEFLLAVEFGGNSITYHPQFEEMLDATRSTRLDKDADEFELDESKADEPPDDVPMPNTTTADDTSPLTETRTRFHDVLHAYYAIARGRFVDVACQQVVDHFLLHAADGPLAVLADHVVLRMSPDQLEAIAGEGLASRDRREKLARDIEHLTKALKILKG